MRIAKTILICIIATSAAAVATASPALAAPTFGKCVEVAAGKGSFTNPDCTKAGAGNYEWSPYAVSLAATASGKLTFVDTKEKSSVACTILEEGTVGPNSADETTKIIEEGGGAKIKCEGVLLCEKAGAETEAINLPWKTELYEAAGAIRDRVGLAGGKTPGWKVSCMVLGIKVTDTCEGRTTAAMKNILNGELLTGTAEVTFNEEAATGTCSLGGANTGKVEGSLILAVEGGGV
jgi:hypothetical protein